MLLTTTNNNLFDTFFSDPWFNDPWFDDRDVQKAQKKLYGHNGKRMIKAMSLRWIFRDLKRMRLRLL